MCSFALHGCEELKVASETDSQLFMLILWLEFCTTTLFPFVFVKSCCYIGMKLNIIML